MDIRSTQTDSMIANRHVQIRATELNGVLDLTISAVSTDGTPIPILKRLGENHTEVPWQVQIPTNCTFRIDRTSDTAALIISGQVSTVDYEVMLRISDGSPWVEVSELLCLDRLSQDITLDWFEAVWQFVEWHEPGEVFSPLLVPKPSNVVGQHVMRAPALAAQCGGRAIALVYSVDSIYRTQALPACMNLIRKNGTPTFTIGLRPHQVSGHVYFSYVRAPASQARFHFSYFIYTGAEVPDGSALDAANRKLWSKTGSRSLKATPGLPVSYEEYASLIYPRVLDRLWAESHIDGRRVGAICANRSYPNDVWMCPWFSQIRSAYGMFLWGRWLNEPDWVDRAIATRDLHLAAPQVNGLFPTVFVFGQMPEQNRWVHSHHQGGGPGIYHLMDMSWTTYQLLRWHRDLIPDEQTIEFARRYGKGILALQRMDGGLPAYVDAKRFVPIDRVDSDALLADLERHPGGDSYVPYQLKHAWCTERFTQSAEDATSLLFLAELVKLLPEHDANRDLFLGAAIRIADWLKNWVYQEARWVDFEVYFSCSPKQIDFYDERSGQWPQNTLCMHAAAAGMLALYNITRDTRYLNLAKRAMDRLTLYQQVWDPPFLNVYGFGGYGVMNTDGEWHDARQAQFADTHLDFYSATGDIEQLERAKAARMASFITLFEPINSAIYPTGWNRQPEGMAAENHGHGGSDHLCGVSGFDWGAGSALATAAYLRLSGVD